MLWINKDKLNCTSATHINHKFNEQLNQGEKSTQKSRNAIRTTRDDPKDQLDIEKLQQLKYRNRIRNFDQNYVKFRILKLI